MKMTRGLRTIALVTVACLVCAVLVGNVIGQRDGRARRIRGIVEALRKGDVDRAKQLARKTGREEEELEHVMEIFHSRLPAGKAEGKKRRPNTEKYLLELEKAKWKDEDVAPRAKLLEEIGYQVAGVALVTEAMPPRRERGKKTKARWATYAESMREGGMELVNAAQGKSSAGVRDAVVRINSQCKSCHKVFRGEDD